MKDNMKTGYILCTVAKNEEKYFPKTASDVLSQICPPKIWLLLDDGSTDQTSQFMKELTSKYKWVYYYRYSGPRNKDLGRHLACIKNKATEIAITIALRKKILYEYIGILDADIRIAHQFYESLMNHMRKKPEIGLISAEIEEIDMEGNLYLKNGRADIPGGATMFCRRQCFDDIGGIDPESYPFDAILVAKAKLMRWLTERSKSITALQMRKTSTMYGVKKGYAYEGEKVFFLRYNLFYVLARAIYIALTESLSCGFAFFVGYAKKVLNSDDRLKDKELINYFRRTRFREIVRYKLQYILKQFKRMFFSFAQIFKRVS